MSKTKRGWLVVAAALAVAASGITRADDSGGGDAGDNGMNPMYGDSYATLEGQGHNVGTPRMAPQGAFAAHEMDGQATTPLIDQMRHNWDAMVEKTRAMTDRMRTSMNTQGSATSATNSTASTPAPGVDTSSGASNSQPSTESGARIAPVNPKGQAPTIVGPTGG